MIIINGANLYPHDIEVSSLFSLCFSFSSPLYLLFICHGLI